MFKLWISVVKEWRLLCRDRVGLLLMFIMPVFLAVIMTALQDSTFKMVNENKLNLVVCNLDTHKTSLAFIAALSQAGFFHVSVITEMNEQKLLEFENEKNALATLIIPAGFFQAMTTKAQLQAVQALEDFGLNVPEKRNTTPIADSINLMLNFKPVLQETYRYSVKTAINGMLGTIQNKLMISELYKGINDKEITTETEKHFMPEGSFITEKTKGSTDGFLPNATQHNIPAWTLFAMFFSVISLGGNLVKEKLSGSFTRLKVMPTSFLILLSAKQLVYLFVNLMQVLFIFSIGIWVFPLVNLPALNIPNDHLGLLLLSIICGWSAVSYALCVGVFAQTQEQANGFGAASIVILAAIGGIFVPEFAMPFAFKMMVSVSPFHWALQSFYSLFLENIPLKQIMLNVLPLLAGIIVLQLISILRLKQKNLI
jgi:ABC-2 type transport system permease protein